MRSGAQGLRERGPTNEVVAGRGPSTSLLVSGGLISEDRRHGRGRPLTRCSNASGLGVCRDGRRQNSATVAPC